MDSPVAQCGRHRGLPLEPIAEPKFVDERNRATVRAEEVVVELLEPQPWLNLEPRGKASGKRLPLDDRDSVPSLPEPQRRGQAQGTCAQDGSATQDTPSVGSDASCPCLSRPARPTSRNVR